MKEQRVTIPSGHIRLEGLLSIQEAFSFGGVVLCHPHPQYGGDMHSSVIGAGVQAAYQEGFSTLRFNFRGVGESEGAYDDGKGEREDVKAAIDYLSSRLGAPQGHIVVLGYSFGAWVGLPVGVKEPKVGGIVAVAPPLEMDEFEYLVGCKKHKLLIAGSEDPYCPVSRLESLYQRLEEPKSLVIVQGADHFFFGHIHALMQPLRRFFHSMKAGEIRE